MTEAAFCWAIAVLIDTTAVHMQSYNVAYFLAEQAQRQPQCVAVRAPCGRAADGSICYQERSFAQLNAEACATAHYLTAKGVRRGSRVLLMVRPGLDLIRIVFALFRMGAVPVVIDPGMGLRQFLRCVRSAQPDALLGIPAAIWIARVCRRSFRGVAHKIPVGRRFARRLSAYAAQGDYPLVTDPTKKILGSGGHPNPPFLTIKDSVRVMG